VGVAGPRAIPPGVPPEDGLVPGVAARGDPRSPSRGWARTPPRIGPGGPTPCRWDREEPSSSGGGTAVTASPSAMNILQILFGWPVAIAGLLLTVAGMYLRWWHLVLAGAVVALPFLFQFTGTPGFRVIVYIVMALHLGSAGAVARGKVAVAILMIAPFLALILFAAILSLGGADLAGYVVAVGAGSRPPAQPSLSRASRRGLRSRATARSGRCRPAGIEPEPPAERARRDRRSEAGRRCS
jgi:hypothetical protein